MTLVIITCERTRFDICLLKDSLRMQHDLEEHSAAVESAAAMSWRFRHKLQHYLCSMLAQEPPQALIFCCVYIIFTKTSRNIASAPDWFSR